MFLNANQLHLHMEIIYGRVVSNYFPEGLITVNLISR